MVVRGGGVITHCSSARVSEGEDFQWDGSVAFPAVDVLVAEEHGGVVPDAGNGFLRRLHISKSGMDVDLEILFCNDVDFDVSRKYSGSMLSASFESS